MNAALEMVSRLPRAEPQRRCSWLRFQRRGQTICLLMLLALSGCAGLQRNAVPEHLVESAAVAGYTDIRAWGDEFSEVFQASLVRSFSEELPGDFPRVADGSRTYHALALSAGGSHGAFGAGLLCGWSKNGSRPPFKLVTGVSTGAIIAPFAFVGPSRDHSLREVYTSVSQTDIVEERSFWNWFTSDSIGDTTPLAKLLNRYIDAELLAQVADAHRSGRRLYVGTTNLDAQRLVIWDLGAIAASDRSDALQLFRDVLMASAAIPVIFPPIYIKVEAERKAYDEMHVDGAVRQQLIAPFAVLDGVSAAQEAGLSRDQVRAVLYVVRNGQLHRRWQSVAPRTTAIAQRALTTMTNSMAAQEIYWAFSVARRRGVEFRIAAIPETFQPSSEGEFNRAEMGRVFELGYQMGLTGNAWERKPPNELLGGAGGEAPR